MSGEFAPYWRVPKGRDAGRNPGRDARLDNPVDKRGEARRKPHVAIPSKRARGRYP